MSAKAASKPKAEPKPAEDPEDLNGMAPEDAVATAYNQLRACDVEQRQWVMTLTKCLNVISSKCDNDPAASEAERAKACRSLYDRISRICDSDLPTPRNDLFGA